MKTLSSRAVRLLRNTVKVMCARLASTLFRSKSYPLFGIPTGVIKEAGVIRTVSPSSLFHLSPPKTIDAELYKDFKACLEWKYHEPEAGILTLEKAISTALGGNLTSQWKMVETFYQVVDGNPGKKSDLFRFSTKRFFPRIYKSDIPVITLSMGRQGAFYHWMFEVLPRLHVVEKAGYSLANTLLYIESKAPFQKQSLELLQIPSERVINADQYAAVSAPTLIIPSIPEIQSQCNCEFLRRKFLPQLEKKADLRLYITRNDASRRRVVNEKEVFDLLSRYGFVKYELSALSLKEQAELFLAATAIISPHGAALSHLVFCRPSTPVLEFFDPNYFNSCYWFISNSVKLNYHYLFGEPHTQLADPDIFVDLKKLEASLHLMRL